MDSVQGIRLAAGELTLRVAEERRRRAVMLHAVGPVREARMQGLTGAVATRCRWTLPGCCLVAAGAWNVTSRCSVMGFYVAAD